MKILIAGNLGYVGPGVVKEFRNYFPDAELIGFDIGYFAKQITNTTYAPECLLNSQHYGDIRNFPESLLNGVDTVVDLAAISNDPIGNQFEEVTLDINYRAAVALATKARQFGVKNFIYASSCSVYGFADDKPRTELSDVNPLTAYAKSKVYTERELESLADENFKVTCLRFATACGMSDRLRLDLVLNDFVAGAITSKEITILSDGTPWRPLINVLDMARAIRWGHERGRESGGNFVIVNAGSDQWNYMIRDLAYEIRNILPDVSVSINKDASPDNRSYKVSFEKFKTLAPHHQPVRDLKRTIIELKEGLTGMRFDIKNFRESDYIRLNIIRKLVGSGMIDEKTLEFIGTRELLNVE